MFLTKAIAMNWCYSTLIIFAFFGWAGDVARAQSAVFVMHVDGSNVEKVSHSDDRFIGGLAWSHDGKRLVDTIIGFEHGTNVSKEGKSEGFTHCFVVTFRDEKSLATYLDHPAHAEYVQVVRDKRDKVVVFDYWANEPAKGPIR